MLCREGREALRLIDRAGKPTRLPTVPGAIRAAIWAPQGRTVFYLVEDPEPGQLPALRMLDVASGGGTLISRTSRFADFSSNGDASVFVGASASKAARHVILMLRTTRREFVLCEHRASNADLVAPVFSPRSQFVFFHSDRDGKRAIYMVDVERLVAETES